MGNWSLISIQEFSDNKAGDGASVTLLSDDEQIELTLYYLLYANLPVIRKSLIIKNLSPKLKHAEENWLSNFYGSPDENVDLRVRNMAWWRSPAIPATALVIGNPEMQDKGWEMHLKSLADTLPIMLGEPRKLSDPD